MIKLYKKIDKKLHYWEIWENDKKSATVHYGIVGEEGESKTIHSSLFSNHTTKIQKELNNVIEDEFVA